MSVQDILATHDCSVAGCPGEAYERGGLRRYHQTTSDRPRPVAAGSHAHLMEERPPVDTCKQPGCTNPTAGKGGPWKNYCQNHMSEEIARRQAVRHAKPKTVKPPPVGGQPKRTAAPPVAANPPAQAAPERLVDGQTSLVQLAQTVEDAAQEIEYARNRHANAIHALRQALEAS